MIMRIGDWSSSFLLHFSCSRYDHQPYRQAELLEFVHSGEFGSRERLDRLHLGTRLGAYEVRGKPLLIDFSPSTFTEDDHGKRVDLLSAIITHPFFMQRRAAMVGIPREDAETALLGAHIRGCDAEVFESRGDAITWLGVPDSQDRL